MMKKILNLLCSVILLCFLTSCDPIRNNPFDYDELVNETDRIELIWYDNPDAKEYWTLKESKLLPFYFEKMEIIETLPEEDETLLLHYLVEQVTFKLSGRVMDSPSGLCVRLIYKNGNFEIFVADREKTSPGYCYAGSFFENGEVNRFIGTTLGISALIDTYFPNYEG